METFYRDFLRAQRFKALIALVFEGNYTLHEIALVLSSKQQATIL